MVNPYAPPRSDSAPPPPSSSPSEALRAIARQQRNINLAVLAYLGLVVSQAVIGRRLGPLVLLGFSLAVLGVMIASIVGAGRLAHALYGMGHAIFCGILMFVPLVNLITLLVLSSEATKRLRAGGYKVGLLGANPDEIR